MKRSDPQIYVNECSNGIFSLLKKEYDTPRNRALAATARLKQMPFVIEQGKGNLNKPVQLYAQLAIDSARSIDSLFNDSLMTLAKDLSPAERSELVKARDAALVSIHGFADWLEKRLPGMVPFKPMGEENYNYLLKNVYLLPLDAKQVEMLGQAELARYRALESLLPDPSLADPNPARSKNIPDRSAGVSESLRKPAGGDDQFSENESSWSRFRLTSARLRFANCPRRSSRPVPAAS